MSFGNAPIPPLPPRLLLSRAWTDYVLWINTCPSSSLRQLSSSCLRPIPNSRRPLYITIAGPRVQYVHYGISNANCGLQDKGWRLCGCEHGSDHATILATLSITRRWPTVNDTWQLMPLYNDQQNSLVVEVIAEIECNRTCNIHKCSLDPDDPVQFQNTMAGVNKRVGTLQDDQQSLTDNCGQAVAVV
jgi:hypothetical protein